MRSELSQRDLLILLGALARRRLRLLPATLNMPNGQLFRLYAGGRGLDRGWVWEKGVAPTNDLFLCGCIGNSHLRHFSATYNNRGMIVGDGNWQFLWMAEKVASGQLL